MNEQIVKIGIIGLGARAETLLASIFEMPGIAVISDMEVYAAGSGVSIEIIDEIADDENE